MNAINGNSHSLFLTIRPGDFLVHHAIALGLHTTTLVLVKGALEARVSKLMPYKKDFGYSFPCDGPGRGGTLDISALGRVLFGSFMDITLLSVNFLIGISCLGYWIYVLNLLAWLLAGID